MLNSPLFVKIKNHNLHYLHVQKKFKNPKTKKESNKIKLSIKKKRKKQ